MASKPIIKRETNRKIKFDYDLSEFEKNANKFIKDAQEKTKDMLIKVAPDFANYAAKYTPPSVGKSSIEKQYYTRPILVLNKLLAGEYNGYEATEEDKEQMRKKMKFKVLYTKKGIKKGTAFAYTKTLSQAKQAAKIANRGLSRVMWGKELSTIKADIPSSLQRLIRKSPNISKYDYNKVNITEDKDETSVNITNSVKNIERYAKIAEKYGYKKVSSSLMRELKKIAEHKTEL